MVSGSVPTAANAVEDLPGDLARWGKAGAGVGYEGVLADVAEGEGLIPRLLYDLRLTEALSAMDNDPYSARLVRLYSTP